MALTMEPSSQRLRHALDLVMQIGKESEAVMPTPVAYRDRIYKRYHSVFMDGSRGDGPAASRWGRAYDWYLRGWLPSEKQAPILDVGCGAGGFLLFLHQRGYSLATGVDISAEQVAAARRVTPDVHEANALEWLERSERRWGLIVALDLIEHLHKDELVELLCLAYSCLVPGGRIIVQAPNASCPWGAQSRYGDFTHEVGLTPLGLSRLLRLAGFQQVEAREAGPMPLGYSLASTVRYGLWRLIRLRLLAYNLIETGEIGDGVLTRVFLASAVKPPDTNGMSTAPASQEGVI